ncbi:hypothetical protein EVAR_81893_1 [Eumeta japonica]|uniref:Uncharacterized protein n=1 Tax=Eumeta variegata TaxID=151549 RepID=A0A4C1UX20_EUMVA|nr:hypothetical protein EVAR_81893_1 [Eumeta japonica]
MNTKENTTVSLDDRGRERRGHLGRNVGRHQSRPFFSYSVLLYKTKPIFVTTDTQSERSVGTQARALLAPRPVAEGCQSNNSEMDFARRGDRNILRLEHLPLHPRLTDIFRDTRNAARAGGRAKLNIETASEFFPTPGRLSFVWPPIYLRTPKRPRSLSVTFPLP